MTTLEWLEEAVRFIGDINGGDRECPMCDQDRNAGECSENCCLNEMEKHIDDMQNQIKDTSSTECPTCGSDNIEVDPSKTVYEADVIYVTLRCQDYDFKTDSGCPAWENRFDIVSTEVN